MVDFFSHEFGHFIIQHYTIQGPSLVSTGDLLSHGSQETLRVEEACHPEDTRTPLKQPTVELGITIQEICEPES